ncbi:MAG: NTP transferase domain-containing protein [Planctomycetes bacterium]|nr:NTP transferase domain-containing protein [Planctomycetota bacterium]MCB9886946.1 NTP transferase domain-containing protein [Planctomycetota bacterium]
MSDDLMGVILAAGKGTRMRPFSERWPKPILPVLGVPLMAYQLRMMAGLGVRRVVVVIGHLGHEVVRALGDGAEYGVEIRYVEQEETLGIAHAVSRLEPHVDRSFFLFLGDIYFDTENLGSMLERFRAGKLGGVLACRREPDLEAIKRNFVVLADADHVVHRVIEKPRHPRTDLKGCGIYLFDQAFFDAVRRTPRTALRNEYEITDSIQIFLDDGYRVEAAEVVKADMNVSYPADLLQLNLLLLAERGEVNFVDAGARVQAGATLDRCVVMGGATVGADAALTECMLFPGAAVPAGQAFRRTIFTPDGEIRCEPGAR